ncbi:MAG: pentapeptide repeat-containing protein [Phycisphaerales bacterium JB064]
MRASSTRAANFTQCSFRQCSFREVELNGTTFDNTSLRGSQFHLVRLSSVKLSEVDLSNIKGLFGPNRAFAHDSGIKDHHTESARFHRPWKIRKGFIGIVDRAVDLLERHAAHWERLRTIGQLRLFGVSYLAVIAITSYTLFARWHNTRVVSSARAAAERARQTGEDDMWATLLGALPQLPTPAHLGYQLAATAALAIAATIYALWCPNEVREATEVGWTRRMGQPLWEYRSAKWSRAWARYSCLVLFLIGGAYTLWYLVARAGSAVVYLLQGLSAG